MQWDADFQVMSCHQRLFRNSPDAWVGRVSGEPAFIRKTVTVNMTLKLPNDFIGEDQVCFS